MRPRHLIVRLFTPLIWRVSEKRKLDALQIFSDTELDSGWQSLFTLEKIDDPKIKGELFQHALEEFHHAEMFAALLSSYANAPLNRQTFAREPLLGSGTNRAALLDFLAQVHVGEMEVHRDFLIYGKTNLDLPIRSLFDRVKKDEEVHEEISWKLMLLVSGGNVRWVRWCVFRKHLMLFWKRYVKATQVVGNLMLWVNITVIYVVLGAVFCIPLRRRILLDRASQLKIFRTQLQASGYPEDVS